MHYPDFTSGIRSHQQEISASSHRKPRWLTATDFRVYMPIPPSPIATWPLSLPQEMPDRVVIEKRVLRKPNHFETRLDSTRLGTMSKKGATSTQPLLNFPAIANLPRAPSPWALSVAYIIPPLPVEILDAYGLVSVSGDRTAVCCSIIRRSPHRGLALPDEGTHSLTRRSKTPKARLTNSSLVWMMS